MRRADRLFQIVDLLRAGRLTTARDLAERLEVSERTIYRDIADLVGSGVPIDGAAGMGYMMRAGYDLPPLMLTRDEASALVAGARMLRAFGGPGMSRAADEAMDKVLAVLPGPLRQTAMTLPMEAIGPVAALSGETRRRLDQIEVALQAHCALDITYTDLAGNMTERRLEPGMLLFWGQVWTLAGFCHLRQDYRAFRVDRLQVMAPGPAFGSARAREIAAAMERMRHF